MSAEQVENRVSGTEDKGQSRVIKSKTKRTGEKNPKKT
jgi:hypothetical protein